MEDVTTKPDNPTEPVYVWNDITTDFFGSIKELKLGELMRHYHFGLFEAMSAIEMMDPKMDAGMCCNKKTVPLTFETAVASGQLKLDNLLYSELIGVIDSLLACLVSWLEGHSPAQTVYTCLYMHNMDAIQDKSLKAFCFGFNNVMDQVKEFINAAIIFEEEDFQPLMFPYPLKETPHNTVYTMLKQAEEELIKAAKNSTTDDQAEDVQAVINRLKFLRFFLDTLISFEYDEAKKDIDIRVVKQLNILSDLLVSLKKTIDRGTQPEPNSDAPNPMGFSPLVNQRLLAPTFPRYSKIKERMASIVFLEELVQRLKLICKVTGCNNYHSALNFFKDFSRKAAPCLLSRSMLQKFYLNSFISRGLTPFKEFLKDSARQFIAPPALMPSSPLYHNEEAQKCVDSFFAEIVNTMFSFLQLCGYNRARQRDKLVRLLDDFVNRQDAAERLDLYLHSLTVNAKPSEIPRQYLASFGTWVLYNSLRAMCCFLLSGLELELYSVHEYLYIFWYLYEFLFGWIVSALTRADSFLGQEQQQQQQQQQQNQNSAIAGAKGSQSQKKADKKDKKKNRKGQNGKPYATEIMLNQALQNMCGGYYKGIAGFIRDDRIPQPLPMFDNEVIRFNYRFAPFASFTTPPAVPYCEFRDMRANLLKVPSADLYAAAAQHFMQARSLLEQIPNPDSDINDTLRVAKVNIIVMNLLAKGHKKDSKAPPQFDFSTHRYFPTINGAI